VNVKSEYEAALMDVFVQRNSGSANGRDQEQPDSPRIDSCLDLHGIRRERSYLARDGKRILCHFRAPDAESLRMALHVAGIDYDALWAGAVKNISLATDPVLVLERVFERPVSLELERRCRAETGRRLLDLGVEPARVLQSRCRKRLLWLCRASSPATARAAENELAGHGFEVWRCDSVSPAERRISAAGCSSERLAERA